MSTATNGKLHVTYICFQHDEQCLTITHYCNVNVGVSIRTNEEGFWGPITCQQLHRSWIEPEPEPHSQY